VFSKNIIKFLFLKTKNHDWEMKMLEKDKEQVLCTRKIIDEYGLDAEIIYHDTRNATTAEACASLGVDASDIAKSILFIAKDGSPHLVVILGHKRVSIEKLKKILGQDVRIAKPDEVIKHTGTEVGAVTPIGCKNVTKHIDKTLLEKEYVYASAGSQFATLKIRTKDLIEYTKGNLVDVAE
jgi:prolyl-tRNA editing enzyme YbaK/EbsC (Cys-tRNA(Pro) deacylase)